MYNEGAPEFFIDQGLYYPSANDYGYYCTGLEVPSNWEEPNRIIVADGTNIQYVGAQTEGLPYVYYTPSYGYAQSPYNPYNPYIPGAMIGIDDPTVGGQQFYSIPPYQNLSSAADYVPYPVQQNFVSSGSYDPWLQASTMVSSKPDGRGLKHNFASGSISFPKSTTKTASDQRNSWKKVSEVPEGNFRPGKEQVVQGNLSSGSVSSHLLQGRPRSGSIQPLDKGKPVTHHVQMKVSLPAGNAIPWTPDIHGDQNRGPRTRRSNSQLTVKAHTTKAGDCDAQGNIIIHTDHYNKDDFPLDYANAKFFVIKSYSEDDVHKSVKYNVWSSTTHGNKKLGAAYEDAQRLAAGSSQGCPIFLFFSVNASGQFCGVAEMTGPVDFQKDMDFWQQDKWGGCFPVKWHFIKDVPNLYLRHIILENNESKPVTHSRDTQEIMFNQGLEMLKIYKSAPLKTSIFDDFMYYENRQKTLLEEKAKLLAKSLVNPFMIPAIELPHKIDGVLDIPLRETEAGLKNNDLESSSGSLASATHKFSSNTGTDNRGRESTEQIAFNGKDDISSKLSFGTLSINPRQGSAKSFAAVAVTEPVDPTKVVAVSAEVKKQAESSSSLTIGTIPLDLKALRVEKGGASN